MRSPAKNNNTNSIDTTPIQYRTLSANEVLFTTGFPPVKDSIYIILEAGPCDKFILSLFGFEIETMKKNKSYISGKFVVESCPSDTTDEYINKHAEYLKELVPIIINNVIDEQVEKEQDAKSKNRKSDIKESTD